MLPESPAEKGGLKEGDVIRKFDGKAVKDLKSLLQIVSRTEVGKDVTIRVVRDKKEIPVSVKIGEWPSETEDLKDEPAAKEAWRGLEVANITMDIARRYRIDQISGVIATNVENATPAHEAGIEPGDIIDRINNKPVTNTDEYYSIIFSIKGDALIRTNRGFTVIKAPKID